MDCFKILKSEDKISEKEFAYLPNWYFAPHTTYKT